MWIQIYYPDKPGALINAGRFLTIERDREVICFESETPEGYYNAAFKDGPAAVKAFANIADALYHDKRFLALDSKTGEVIA